MDLGSWTNRFKEATGALPFKGLDEMAAEDDYVHSEGLNVKRQDDNEVELEMPHNSVTDFAVRDQQSSCSNSEQQRPLHTALEESHEQNSWASIPGGHLGFSSSFAPSSNKENNDEMNAEYDSSINSFDRQESIGNRSTGVLEMEVSESAADPVERPFTRSKQKHRFMEDLDNRLSRANISGKSTVTATLSSNSISSNKNDDNISNRGAGSWLLGLGRAASRDSTLPDDNEDNEQSNPNASVPPLSRQRISPKAPGKSDPSHHYSVVTSKGMLDADELLALEQIRHLNETQQSDTAFFRLKEMVQGHPRESFIVFTLFLSIAVYFFIRNISNEDDVN